MIYLARTASSRKKNLMQKNSYQYALCVKITNPGHIDSKKKLSALGKQYLFNGLIRHLVMHNYRAEICTVQKLFFYLFGLTSSRERNERHGKAAAVVVDRCLKPRSGWRQFSVATVFYCKILSAIGVCLSPIKTSGCKNYLGPRKKCTFS